MRVSVEGCLSDSCEVLSGVPQGSVLGPLLFLIYVNFLTPAISCNWKAFADDFKFYLGFPRHPDLLQRGGQCLQGDLDAVVDAAESWNLSLNVEKCCVMRFCRGNLEESHQPKYFIHEKEISTVSKHKDLGIWIDVSLRFHDHVRVVVGRASSLVSELLRSTVCRDADFMTELFVSHVRPLLDGCSTVWNVGYVADVRLIESVQRRWTREIEGMRGFDYANRLHSLGLFSMNGRLLRADLIKVWKVFHTETDVGLSNLFERAPDERTRGHAFKLVFPRCRTELRRRWFDARCVLEWNALPSQVVEAGTLQTFKKALEIELGDRLYSVI